MTRALRKTLKGYPMQTLPKTPLAALIALLLLASCGPLVGAGVAVGADEIAEEDDGGDGLF